MVIAVEVRRYRSLGNVVALGTEAGRSRIKMRHRIDLGEGRTEPDARQPGHEIEGIEAIGFLLENLASKSARYGATLPLGIDVETAAGKGTQYLSQDRRELPRARWCTQKAVRSPWKIEGLRAIPIPISQPDTVIGPSHNQPSRSRSSFAAAPALPCTRGKW